MPYMPLYEELNPIKPNETDKGIKLVIQPSFDPAYAFYFLQTGDEWIVKHFMAIELNALWDIIRENDIWNKRSLAELMKIEEFKSLALSQIYVRSWQIEGKTAKLLQNIYDNGLPDTEKFPSGFDGHSYEMTFLGKEGSYRCWCALPPEWGSLEKLIDICVKEAKLDRRIYGQYR